MDLSIVIVNWNTRPQLAACLASIITGCQHFGLQVETIVVDNASDDDSALLVRESFTWVSLIANGQNLGFACANNQAIREAHGRYLLLLNSDTEVLPGALACLVQFMDAHPQAGAAGPRLLNGDGSLQASCQPMLTPERELWRLCFLDTLSRRATYPIHRWDTKTPRQVEVLKGACFLLRRAALDQVGLLDERYFMYTEEIDLCYRLSQVGWQLWWVPAAQVVHYGEASTRQVAEAMYVQLYRSKIQFYRKFGDEPRVRRYKRFIQLVYWPRLVVSWLGARLRPSMAQRARTFRRLLSELSDM